MFKGTPIKLEIIPIGKKIFRVAEPFEYHGRAFKILVPKGWVTDLTSKPQIFFWIKKEGAHTPASIIHDWMYAKGYILSEGDIQIPISRRTADRIYNEAMKKLDVPRLRRKQIYWGIKLIGFASWNKYRHKDSNQ